MSKFIDVFIKLEINASVINIFELNLSIGILYLRTLWNFPLISLIKNSSFWFKGFEYIYVLIKSINLS